MRKNKRWVIIGLIIVVMFGIIGGVEGKKYMDNQKEAKEMMQEKKIALQAKSMFKNIKDLKIEQIGEASPGSIFFIVEITNTDDKKYKADLDLGDVSSYSTVDGDNFLETQLGSTTSKINVYYLSGESGKL
ncbi:hypothetical protein [Lactococcus allomyrinae]|uniref:Uncharacterized protein n=1 Tax=Lactococcus allomyrinae TaxID=2419773 RepID=A0A387BMW6_9LACT|nr:hypothetical protein [Lactococcus allomyrinae]AYF99870.1 hypothetical protein D7I46_01485 [Lactococcus allomyrinae]